jgi:hypothetical protein
MGREKDRNGQRELDFGSPLPRSTAKIIRLSSDITERPTDRPDFLHAGLCQVGLPRSRVPDLTFERTSGKASILLQAGKLWDGDRGEWVQQPLPYGTRPRLALVHISTEAVRTRSPVIPVGKSAREFLMKLGLDVGGRSYNTFSSQMRSLACCHISLGFGSETLSAAPIKRFSAWSIPDAEAGGLTPGVIELTPDFYESLVKLAVPLDPRALAALKHSALALDVYAWLVHRLHRIKAPTFLSWRNLHEQFGQEYAEVKLFKREFLRMLRMVHAVYPTAKIEQVNGGIKLKNSPPAVPKTLVYFGQAG